MERIVSQRDLERAAQDIDVNCDACWGEDKFSPEEAVYRNGVRDALVALAQKYNEEAGMDISRFTSTLLLRCEQCWASGKKIALLSAQFTCGIRLRIPEL